MTFTTTALELSIIMHAPTVNYAWLIWKSNISHGFSEFGLAYGFLTGTKVGITSHYIYIINTSTFVIHINFFASPCSLTLFIFILFAFCIHKGQYPEKRLGSSRYWLGLVILKVCSICSVCSLIVVLNEFSRYFV